MFSNVILYEAGCYGTLVEWFCYKIYNNNLSHDTPFLGTGSSHKYQGNFFFPPAFMQYISSHEAPHTFCRVHPGLEGNLNAHQLFLSNKPYQEIISDDISILSANFNKTLVLYPDASTALSIEDNRLEKSSMTSESFIKFAKPLGYHEEYFRTQLTNDFALKVRHELDRMVKTNGSPFTIENIRMWGKESVYELETWEFRELLSLYWFTQLNDIVDSWRRTVEAFDQQRSLMFISTACFKHNFPQTIERCVQHFGLTVTDEVRSLIQFVESKWAPLQKHHNKDDLVQKIVEHTLTGDRFSWDHIQLTILDEALIQKLLRDNHVELKCCGLNIFPSSTSKLQEITQRI